MKNFLFLTTASFAANPRLVKEVRLALDMSCNVTIVIFRLGNWSDAKSDLIVTELGKRGEHTHSYCDTTRSSSLNWFFWGVADKLARLFYPYMPGYFLLNTLASSKRSFQLFWA